MKMLRWVLEDWWRKYRSLMRVVLVVIVAMSLVCLLVVSFYWTVGSALERELADVERDYFPIQGDYLGRMSPRWSADGTRVTFGSSFNYGGEVLTFDVAKMRLQLIQGSGNNDVKWGAGPSQDMAFSPRVSPDGSQIAYAAFEHSTWLPWVKHYDWEIVISNLDGSMKRRLTKREGYDLHPVWSPDGNEIAFLSGRHIHVMGADGSDVRSVVLSVGAALLPPVWSPDGRSIAFVGEDRNETTCGRTDFVQRPLHIVEIDGGEQREIGHILDSTLPAWSPDGRLITFSRLRDCLGELHAMGHNGSHPSTVLLYPLGINFALGPRYGTSWSPDGRRILMGTFVVTADGSSAQRLPTPNSAASWSPDGSRLAVHVLNNGFNVATHGYDASVRLYTVAADGSDVRTLVVQDRDGNLSAANSNKLLVYDQQRIDGVFGCYHLAEPSVLVSRSC